MNYKSKNHLPAVSVSGYERVTPLFADSGELVAFDTEKGVVKESESVIEFRKLVRGYFIKCWKRQQNRVTLD